MRRVQPSTRSFYAVHIDTFHSACKRRERESEYTHTHTSHPVSIWTSGRNIEREKTIAQDSKSISRNVCCTKHKNHIRSLFGLGSVFFVCRLLNFVFMLHTQSFNHSVDSFYLEQIHYTFVVMSERDCEQLPLLWVSLCVCVFWFLSPKPEQWIASYG